MTKNTFEAQVNFCWNFFRLNQIHSLGKVKQAICQEFTGQKNNGKITTRNLTILYNV